RDGAVGQPVRPRLRWVRRRAGNLLLDPVQLRDHRVGGEPLAGASGTARPPATPLIANAVRREAREHEASLRTSTSTTVAMSAAERLLEAAPSDEATDRAPVADRREPAASQPTWFELLRKRLNPPP